MSGREVSTAAVGWTMFAAVMMWLIGFYHALAGLVGILEDQFYLATPNYILQFDATTWGWIHLIVGVIVILAGVAVINGRVWGRTVGVIMALIGAVGAFSWLPYYPIWGIILIALDVFVIWALTVHGRDITVA